LPERKIHSLSGRITEPLMLQAFKAVKKNRGAAGIDKVSISMFEQNLEENLCALMKRLKKGTYFPYPLRRKYIPKGKKQIQTSGHSCGQGQSGSGSHSQTDRAMF